ncbi:hypothetical protein [Massilia sp. GCM10023247]|uniref:hypothetical protein n=1 Tax=Massilia sp. GCM10023247 TaxID=3252643 RepID=UPI0036145400
MNQNPAFDSSIPVLTEVVLEPPVEAAPVELAAAEPAPAPQAVPEPDWDALELRIVERIVAQLQPQLDAVVRNALASAGDQIHIGLRQTIEQMVAQQIASVQR